MFLTEELHVIMEDSLSLATGSCFRFIVPMQNGDLDSKGLLSSLIEAQGTIESFKVWFSEAEHWVLSISSFVITKWHISKNACELFENVDGTKTIAKSS